MTNQGQRLELEKRIIEAEDKVEVSLSNLGWLDSKELFELERSWSDLVGYYQSNNDDAVIGVETLRSYLHFTRLFRKIMLDPNVEPNDREKLEDCLIGFEYKLEEIIREVVSYTDDSSYFGRFPD